MKWASVPSAYRNCILRASVRTGRNFSPARNVRSMTAPSLARRSFVRTNAPPLPGLTCWNSRILKTVPSTSMWFPFLNWFVLIMGGPAQGTSTRGRYIPTLEPPARCRYVGRERPRRLLDAGTGARPAPAPAERRAACTPDGGGQRPGVRGPVRAPSPGALPLLPRRRSTVELDQAPEIEGRSLEARVEERSRLATLVADLDELPERQRSALVMRELSGLSHEEIAGALEISVAAAKQAIFDARTGLQEFARGREMECAEVQRIVSARDGRMLRGRPLRAHLRGCPSCRALRDAIGARRADLSALAPPLPAAAATGLLSSVLGGGNGGGGLSSAISAKLAS